jgi:3-dehydroquinate synthase
MGAFHHPRAVFADIDLLSTLSPRELRAGLYESIKAGLIRDAGLFRFIEANRRLIDRRDAKTLERIVAASVRMKAEVVALDEKEAGPRMTLNFGHTIGHAIEAVTGYQGVLHGEAVAWGMLAALKISSMRKWLKPQDAERAGRVIRSFDPPALPPLDLAALLKAGGKDKKNRAGVRRFVLLKGIGNAVVTEDVTDAEMIEALRSTLPLRRPGKRP